MISSVCCAVLYCTAVCPLLVNEDFSDSSANVTALVAARMTKIMSSTHSPVNNAWVVNGLHETLVRPKSGPSKSGHCSTDSGPAECLFLFTLRRARSRMGERERGTSERKRIQFAQSQLNVAAAKFIACNQRGKIAFSVISNCHHDTLTGNSMH
uniref:Secreted protein n=1 Tax=Ananas comosus var. bracteatus TaxID=296719 RepID=A0A6V7NGG9_ANACO|nr:unnamed protein product [Ananas comosus var. bracteatus]